MNSSTLTVKMLTVKDNEQVESTSSILIMECHSKHTATWILMGEDGQCSREERMVLSTSIPRLERIRTRFWRSQWRALAGTGENLPTNKASSVLRVDMTSYTKGSKYAKYSNFKVGNSASKYTLHVSGYSGNAGDSLKYQNGIKFTTKDNKNDQYGKNNCAVVFKGAWWYKYKGCFTSNLNGQYAGSRLSNNKYCVWHHFDGSYSLNFTEMKVRR